MNAASNRVTAADLEPRVLPLLADLSQALASSIDIERTLAKAVNIIASCMKAEAASVFLVNQAGTELVCRACAGPVSIVGFELPVGAGIVGRCFTNNACEMVRDAQADEGFSAQADYSSGFSTKSILCAPLVSSNGPIGVIEVLNKAGGQLFDEFDQDLLRVLAAPAAMAISNAKLVGELMQQQRLQRELQLARSMQRSMLPKRRRGGYPVLGVNRPATEISGDFYDYFDLADGRIAFTVGDVAGKGLDASLLMVRTASLLRWSGKDGLAPEQWLQKVNNELAATVSGGMFVCAAVGYLDPRTQHLEWASAGFPPAIVISPEGMEEVPAQGPPLGILPDIDFASHAVNLQDAALYFFSDGVTDVRGLDGERIGMQGVRDLLARHHAMPPGPRLRSIIRELKRLKLQDDTTLLLVQGQSS